MYEDETAGEYNTETDGKKDRHNVNPNTDWEKSLVRPRCRWKNHAKLYRKQISF